MAAHPCEPYSLRTSFLIRCNVHECWVRAGAAGGRLRRALSESWRRRRTRTSRSLSRGPVTLTRLALVLSGLAAAYVLFILLRTSALRLPGYVESFCLMNARRLKEGATLFVDPAVGAPEYGSPPSRWYVGYSLPYVLLIAPFPLDAVWGRSLSFLLLGTTLALASRTHGRSWRVEAVLCALVVLGAHRMMFMLLEVRPDALALLLATIAFRRALRKGGADALESVLFGVAFCVKPSVLALGAGTLLTTAVTRRSARPIAGAAAPVIAYVCMMQWMSGGLWLAHYRAGIALGYSFTGGCLRGLAEVGPFIAAPVAIGVASVAAAPRGPRACLAAGLCTSLLVGVAGLGKPGSAVNYLMEPAIAAVVVVAGMPPLLARGWVAVACIVQVVWNVPVPLRAGVQPAAVLEAQRSALAAAKDRCEAASGEAGAFVLSNEQGAEWEVNGRIHALPFELSIEARRGRFAWSLMDDDLARARCYVHVADPGTVAPLRRALGRAGYSLDWESHGVALYLNATHGRDVRR